MLLPRYARFLIHTALTLLVLTGVGNIHSHQCLDGQEPAVTVHFENLKGHPVHADEEQHVDVESDIVLQGLPYKAPDQDSPLFLIALSLVLGQRLSPQRPYRVEQDTDSIHPPAEYLPPPRAPPVHS